MVQRKLRLKILPTAVSDLKEITSYIAKDSINYARIEYKRIITFLNKIPLQPLMGKEFHYKSIKAYQLVFRNYIIIYTSDKLFINIITIHHHSRLISNNPNLDYND